MRRFPGGGTVCAWLTNVFLVVGLGGAMAACSSSSSQRGAENAGATGAIGGGSGADDGASATGGRAGSGGGSGSAGASAAAGKGGTSARGGASNGGEPPVPSDLHPGCPALAPSTGQSCTSDGLQCQYGIDPRRACRPLATCQSGSWMVKEGTLAACPELAEADCPASMGQLADQRCAQGAVNAGPYCAYNDVTCVCDPENCDATGTDCAWFCDKPLADANCPWGQPNIGTSCASEGLVCRYTTCADHHCTNGYWTAMSNGSCPMTPVGR
ncbi:MAG TPA: hypothetical protein VER96_24295 [Polyangiaceae bacterium]|nr:hypothetical protein [Polyangiaceae bacterium]